MKILVACEYTGIVREAFRLEGHEGYSNDIIPAEDGSPYHILGDCKEAILSREWDMIIMHPPCTALTLSGNATYAEGKGKYPERLKAVEWTVDLWNLACEAANHVAMENPAGVLPTMGGLKCTQYIQPYEFGHPEKKRTGLWLHNLPPLKPTNIVYEEMLKLPKKCQERNWYMGPSKTRGMTVLGHTTESP